MREESLWERGKLNSVLCGAGERMKYRWKGSLIPANCMLNSKISSQILNGNSWTFWTDQERLFFFFPLLSSLAYVTSTISLLLSLTYRKCSSALYSWQ